MAEPLSDEERQFIEQALHCVDVDSAGHWPTVAGWLAVEVRRLRRIEAAARAYRAENDADEQLAGVDARALLDRALDGA
jgi:hypothetical protein